MSLSISAPNEGHTSAVAAQAKQYLTFMLGSETFAIDILGVKEIIEYGSLTTVPMMPAFIRGVINLRGAVVPVVDLAARFGGKASSITRRTCIVIVETGAEGTTPEVGLTVDAVNEVLEISAAEVEPPPRFGARLRAEFISGMGKVRDNFVILLDVARILSEDELASLGQLPVESVGKAGEPPSEKNPVSAERDGEARS